MHYLLLSCSFDLCLANDFAFLFARFFSLELKPESDDIAAICEATISAAF